MPDADKLTQISEALVLELVQHFGGLEAVPVELQTAVWLIHMRLTEAEAEIARVRAQLAAEVPESAPPRIGGEETGEF